MFPSFSIKWGTPKNEELDNTKQDNTNRTKKAPEENSFGAFLSYFVDSCKFYG